MNLNRRNFLSLLGVTPIAFQLVGETSGEFGQPYETVYKCVNSDYLSPVVSVFHFPLSDSVINYNSKNWIKPNFGKIFVWQTFKDALYHSNNCLRFKILKCRTRSLVKNKCCDMGGGWGSLDLKYAWELPLEDSCGIGLCDSLYVEEEVNNESE